MPYIEDMPGLSPDDYQTKAEYAGAIRKALDDGTLELDTLQDEVIGNGDFTDALIQAFVDATKV